MLSRAPAFQNPASCIVSPVITELDYRYLVTLAPVSGVAEDRIVNTWHLKAVTIGQPSAAQWDSVHAAFQTFYQVFDQYMAADFVALTGHTMKAYALIDSEPRQPVDEGTMTLSGLNAAAIPPECALTLSMRALYVSGQNPQRFRGRVYLGPWATTAVDGDGRPLAALITAVTGAASTLKSSLAAIGDGVQLAIYSRTDETLRAVSEGWCDNEFDTQRSRGRQATARNVWS